jgi:hypothetical protein
MSALGQNEPCHSLREHGRSTSVSGPASRRSALPSRAMGGRDDYIDLTAAVPPIATNLPHRAGRWISGQNRMPIALEEFPQGVPRCR